MQLQVKELPQPLPFEQFPLQPSSRQQTAQPNFVQHTKTITKKCSLQTVDNTPPLHSTSQHVHENITPQWTIQAVNELQGHQPLSEHVITWPVVEKNPENLSQDQKVQPFSENTLQNLASGPVTEHTLQEKQVLQFP